MKKSLRFKIEMIIGLVIFSTLPAFLLIEDSSLLKFAPQYVYVMLPLILITAWVLVSHPWPLKSFLLRTIVLLTIAAPFLIMTAYPFLPMNILMTVAIIFFGLTLPLWNVYLTWWFYTIGGSFPLPKDHNWMIGKKNYKGSGKEYVQFVQKSVGGLGSIGLIGMFLYNSFGMNGAMLFFKIASLLLIFGYSLTFGAHYKKLLLKNK